MTTAPVARPEPTPRQTRPAWHPSAWPLWAKLVASVLALFLAVSMATGLFTHLALERSLMQQTDDSLHAVAMRFDDHPRPAGSDGDDGPGAAPDVLRLVYSTDGSTLTTTKNTAVNKDNEIVDLTVDQIRTLASAGLGEVPKTVQLGGDLGTYRLVAVNVVNRSTGKAETAVSGLSLAPQQHTLENLRTLLLMGIGLGTLGIGAGGTYLVRRSLQPLERVAGTARRVSRLELGSGQVQMTERVDARDTDPRTEVGQVGLALNSMLDNVDSALTARQQSEEKLRRFVADASHELRTPLASIRGYAELSRREKDPVPEGVTHALSRIESEGMRMSGLVEDLLLLARLDAGRPLERRPVDLTMLAITALGDAHAASPHHHWELDLPDEPVEVPGDQARLTQVMVNLLANARTHTPEGTTVVLGLRREGDFARIFVHDNGPGVSEELQRTVFERFSRGDTARTRTGGSTGLGLSIVDSVATAHGGRVELESRPGDTTFSVLVPAS
ncbi:MAG: HAMP domain-containing histidine kinase [Micrococcales bacterium]|nr:HAMP domain-containing histidine kinase [Micrococcales bacterium]